MMDDEVYYTALTNMKFGTGVVLHPASLFTSTSSQYVPLTLDLMKVTTVAIYEELVPPELGTKRKIHVFAVLPPALAAVYQVTDMTPADLLVATVNHNKVLAPSPATTADAQIEEAAEDTDAILKRIGAPMLTFSVFFGVFTIMAHPSRRLRPTTYKIKIL